MPRFRKRFNFYKRKKGKILNISELTRKTIQLITQKGQSITPLIFFDTFCAEARRNRVAVEDCGLINQYIDKLDSEFQKEVRGYNIRNIQEFLSYLTSALNRMNQNHLAHRHQSLFELSKAIVKITTNIDNQKISGLSGRTFALLNRGHSPENLDEMKKEWLRFSSSYNWAKNREQLARYIEIEKEDDIDSIVNKLIPLLEQKGGKMDSNNENHRRVVELLFNGMKPALSSFDNQEAMELYKELRHDESKMFDPETQNRIAQLQSKRVQADRDSEKDVLDKTEKVIESLTKELDKDKDDDKSLLDDVDEIQKDVENPETENKSIFAKLNGKIGELKKKTSSLFGKLSNYRNAIENAKNEFDKLVVDISNKKRDIDKDFLTGLGTEESIKKEGKNLDKKFEKNNENFSVIVVDIDGFRGICRRYGNDAGDLILRYFSKILKSYIAVGDSTARYGEDEFIITLPNRDIAEAKDFIHKFREKVKHTKFLYKDERVNITFSAGISDRQNGENFVSVLDDAKHMMKEAKRLGKDRIEG
jgi:diguanylate cyclase